MRKGIAFFLACLFALLFMMPPRVRADVMEGYSEDSGIRWAFNDETNVQWNLYERYYESIGVSRQTFSKLRVSACSEEKLRQAYFGEGGAYEVPRDRLKDYLEARYVSFRSIRIPKKKLAADGSEADRSEAEKAALDEKIAAGLSAVNNGTGIESVYATFVADRKGDREEYAEIVTDGTDHAYPTEFADAVRAMPVETAAVFFERLDFYRHKIEPSANLFCFSVSQRIDSVAEIRICAGIRRFQAAVGIKITRVPFFVVRR